MKDLVAAYISGLCIVHCLLTPVLLALGGAGLLGHWLEAEWVHYVLITPILLLVGWSLPAAQHRHQQQSPLWLGCGGAALMLLSLAVPAALEPWLAISAGVLLMAAHLMNRHLLQTMAAPAAEPIQK
jgi:NhaP-type Na+/H+ or K+/H+ antiporter